MKRARDDRGVEVDLQRLHKKTRANTTRMRHTNDAGVYGLRWQSVVFLCLIVMMIAIVVGLLVVALSLPPYAIGFISVPLGIVLPLWLTKRESVKRFSERRRLALREGLCPACWYSLRGSLIEEDGRSVCAECGAAWRLAKDQA